jgi:hypothetical protein
MVPRHPRLEAGQPSPLMTLQLPGCQFHSNKGLYESIVTDLYVDPTLRISTAAFSNSAARSTHTVLSAAGATAAATARRKVFDHVTKSSIYLIFSVVQF